MLLKTITDWLNFRDYDLEKIKAAEKLVKRQSRGSVSAQNGWYMTASQLRAQSEAADLDVERLEQTLAHR
jgi:hypothetical protein